MSKKAYTEKRELLLKSNLGSLDGTDFSFRFATQLPQTSPPQSSTSPSKKATSLPLRLAKTGGSPGVAYPPILAFCRGLAGVLKQNTRLTLRKGILEKKAFPPVPSKVVPSRLCSALGKAYE